MSPKYTTEQRRAWPSSTPAARRAETTRRRERLEQNPHLRELRRTSNKVWYQKNQAKSRRVARTHRLKKIYGITDDQFDILWATTDGHCYLCKRQLRRGVGGHAIDHDHKTGEVRGILCYPCNVLLGRMNDDPEEIKHWIEYLEHPPARLILDRSP